MHRSHVIFALIGVSCGASWLGGCSLSERVESKIIPDTVSLADRCGAFMKAAMPFAQIDLGDRGSRSPDVRTIIATVTGTRTDVPRDVTEGRDLAVECTFTDNVLTAFRWTKGGPTPLIGSTPAPPGQSLPPLTPSGQTPSAGNTTPPAGKARPFH